MPNILSIYTDHYLLLTTTSKPVWRDVHILGGPTFPVFWSFFTNPCVWKDDLWYCLEICNWSYDVYVQTEWLTENKRHDIPSLNYKTTNLKKKKWRYFRKFWSQSYVCNPSTLGLRKKDWAHPRQCTDLARSCLKIQ